MYGWGPLDPTTLPPVWGVPVRVFLLWFTPTTLSMEACLALPHRGGSGSRNLV